MRKLFVAICGVTLLAGSACAQEDNHFQDFKRKLIWKGPLLTTALSAFAGEVFNAPKEWGRGIDGFGKRAGSSFGQRAVKASVELGFSERTHEDLHYHRLGTGSVLTRVKHAVVTTYWVPRDNGTGQTLAVGRIAGTFAAPQVARLWMPDRVATFGAATQSAGATFGLDVGLNIVYEFWRPRH